MRAPYVVILPVRSQPAVQRADHADAGRIAIGGMQNSDLSSPLRAAARYFQRYGRNWRTLDKNQVGNCRQ